MSEVIIVDDEPYVRQMIKSMVDWQSLSMQVVAEAFNGEDALAQIMDESRNISIVITDLKMPVMDGLELIKKASEFKPSLKYVVISAYDDFHLVKDAFKLGVQDYLLKPEMTKEQIFNVLNHIKVSASNSPIQTLQSALQYMPSHLTNMDFPQNNDLLKENLLTRFFSGNIDAKGLNTLKRLLCVKNDSRIILAVMKLVPVDTQSPILGNSLRNSIFEDIQKSAKTLLFSKEMQYEIAHLSTYEYGFLLICSQQESASYIINQFRCLPGNLCPDGFCINIGISHIEEDFTLILSLLHEARVSLDHCFAAGNGSIVRYTIFLDQVIPLYVDTKDQIAKLKKFLNSILLNQTNFNINEIIIQASHISTCNIHAVKDLYNKYHFVILDFAQQNGLYNEICSLSEEYEKYLQFHGDLSSFNLWFTSIIKKIMDIKSCNSVINQIKYYIEKHYTKDISLQTVADQFKLNSSYLSRLFSEKENTNFVDYLSQLRIAKAIELMSTSNLKIYKICEEVGYSSPEHFSRTFKKITGKSPKQFMGENSL